MNAKLFLLLFWGVSPLNLFRNNTGKSLSEALIFASTNPQYDDKLFLTFRTIFVQNMFSPCSAKIRAFDKDLPVPFMH